MRLNLGFLKSPRTREREEFARLVSDVMRQAGLSEQDLCEYFDVSVPTVVRWKSGESMPQPATRRRVIARLEEVRNRDWLSDAMTETRDRREATA